MIYKRGKNGIYWYRFMWQGKLIRESTHQTNGTVARNQESAHRTRLSNGEVGIREKQQAPTLPEFLEKDFLPFIEAKLHKEKPKTCDYYNYGARLLLDTELAGLQLDQINSQHTAAFEARKADLSPSTVNCALRTLRRALNLAEEWGKLIKAPNFSLAKGERQREQIVSEAEFLAYRDLCPQPWRDVATLLYGTGMRPGEAYKLRWEHVLVNGHGGFIQIAEGKSRAARRLLPMVPEVYNTLLARWETAGRIGTGWVFPSASRSGHFEESSAKNQHRKALIKSRVKPFEPYCLRHAFLTRLAEQGCDPYTLAKIAGHSSILISQRYCHPQRDSIERAFAKLGGHNFGHNENPQLPAEVATGDTTGS